MKNKKNKEREESKKLLLLFYTENDRVVFTEQFHIQRGHCCGNGCRHCPYEPKYQKGNITLSQNFR